MADGPWALLRWTSASLVLGGLIGVALIFVPPSLGQTEWEFAAFGEMAITLAPLMLGLSGWGIASLASGGYWSRFGVSVAFAGVGSMCLVGAVLAGLNLPLVWAAAGESGVGALRLVGVKTTVLLGWYAIWSLYFAARVFRTA